MDKLGSLWDENDIKIITGNTKILLIAPNGEATKPRDDINTDKLTYRIAERMKCSAIVNDVFKRTRLDFNNIAEASTHNTFIPAIREVVDASGRTLVIWVHGIDDGTLKREIFEMGVKGVKDDVQCPISNSKSADIGVIRLDMGLLITHL